MWKLRLANLWGLAIAFTLLKYAIFDRSIHIMTVLGLVQETETCRPGGGGEGKKGKKGLLLCEKQCVGQGDKCRGSYVNLGIRK